MSIQKKIITWREADRAMLDCAFQLLAFLSLQLRYPERRDTRGSYPIAGGGVIRNGYMKEAGNTQSWWSDHPGTVHLMNEGGFMANLPDSDDTNDRPSAICWYSIQNLVRLRLKDARRELEQKLMPQRKRKRTSKQSSRNKN